MGIWFLNARSISGGSRSDILTSLRQHKFRHGFVDESFSDYLQISGSGMNKTRSGDVVDLARNTAGIVMDKGFGFRIACYLIAFLSLLVRHNRATPKLIFAVLFQIKT